MHTIVYAATTVGIRAHAVAVEVDVSFGMLQFFIVGLPDRAITESRQRISIALRNSGIRLPERKITVNLAPADIPKEGTLFDLPIAIGILQASGLVTIGQQFLQETLFLGELSLDGSIRSVQGVIAIAADAQSMNKKRMIVPGGNAQEAACIEGIEVFGVENLSQVISFLSGQYALTPVKKSLLPRALGTQQLDFAHVKGQVQAKRALQIVAAGRHNSILIGPPGSGKTMLAQRLITIMPELTQEEMIEVSKIYSVSGKTCAQGLLQERPFRSPHHSISSAGLIGGGSIPKPGEISLSHHGILFLDELLEFKRSILEMLRQPLEHKTVSIARAQQVINFPASFLLIAALNPCPCGFFGDTKRRCLCSTQQVQRYLEKLSGPLLDRIDLQLPVPAVCVQEIQPDPQPSATAYSSAYLYAGVQRAVAMQRSRFKHDPTMWNAYMNTELLQQHCRLDTEAQKMVPLLFDRLQVSMRGYHKLLKVARTIADLEESEIIRSIHIHEALTYRAVDHLLERMRSSAS